MTALIIDERDWVSVLRAWLHGRREVHRAFGVLTTCEIHAVQLYKGRGSYCATPTENAQFDRSKRAATGRILLAALAQARFTAVTVGTATPSKPLAYARAIRWLEGWAREEDTRLLIFYDGEQGLATPDELLTVA